MLLYLEGIDRTGKSTLAQQLSAKTQFPIYRKLPPEKLGLAEHHSYFKGIGFALMELHNLFRFNAIVDRSFISDWVYTNRGQDVCPITIWHEWESRHASSKSAIIVYVEAPDEIIKGRVISSPDPYMSPEDIPRFKTLYEVYLRQTRFRVVRVNGMSISGERDQELESVGQLILPA